jgi:hypothetical protein
MGRLVNATVAASTGGTTASLPGAAVLFWEVLLTAVPFRQVWRVLADAQPLPHGRSRAEDRHLNFYESRDNLAVYDTAFCP